MLCIGSIYTLSIFADELIKKFYWYSNQTHLFFGSIIAIFPLTMIILRRLIHLQIKLFLFISAILLTTGYLIAGILEGNFFLVFIASLLQSFAIILLFFIPAYNLLFNFIPSLIGFYLGANFVLFAKGTTSKFGSENFNYYYPIIFLGYVVAVVVFHFLGRLLFDIFRNYVFSITIALSVGFFGTILFLV